LPPVRFRFQKLPFGIFRVGSFFTVLFNFQAPVNSLSLVRCSEQLVYYIAFFSVCQYLFDIFFSDFPATPQLFGTALLLYRVLPFLSRGFSVFSSIPSFILLFFTKTISFTSFLPPFCLFLLFPI
ncbi:MAG: hypothetical protein ACOX64_07045, partial [Candidatus Merdivicinus sp.]